MTLTPDKRHQEDAGRARTASESMTEGSTVGPSVGSTKGRGVASSNVDGAVSLFDQLKNVGLDLTGHGLADQFAAVPGVAAADAMDDDEPEPVDARAETDEFPADFAPQTEPEPLSEPAPRSQTEFQTGRGVPSESDTRSEPGFASEPEPLSEPAPRSAPEAMPDTRRLSQHPMLSDEEWSELSRFAPEVLDSITGLTRLTRELRTFERPMGPEEAVMLSDALEALDRIHTILSAVTLSVFERVGTPTDFGAKTTKSLIQNRLGLTGAEANRRTEAARNLGGRVDMSGQAMQPLAPVVSDALHEGVLSSGQAAVIADCMKRLPSWVSAELREETEAKLVSEAPNVRVSDLREIFQHMLDIIDPDGKEPTEPTDRSQYVVNLRSRRNGDWDISGRLDPVTGGLLNGLLTSRIESNKKDAKDPGDSRGDAAATADAGRRVDPRGACSDGTGGTAGADSHDDFAVIDAVLSGDRSDAPLFAQDGSGAALEGTGIHSDSPGAYGVRVDGTEVSTVDAQPSARQWIYERFATLIGKIEMDRPNSGARYSLVVTAKAEDLAAGTGVGKTGTENPIPMSELRASGLNGRVFFHLMGDKAKTVQVATEKRFADEKQTAIVTSRDMGCSFPGVRREALVDRVEVRDLHRCPVVAG